MQITITIHPSWLSKPATLGDRLAALTRAIRSLEAEYQTPMDPGRPPRADRGDAWEPTVATRADDGLDQLGAGIDDTADEDTPRDGRQLLGWCAKQVPDLKGTIMSYGRKHGLHSKIVAWSPAEVAAAYRFARQAQHRGDRS
jgi:hypothetical protein